MKYKATIRLKHYIFSVVARAFDDKLQEIIEMSIKGDDTTYNDIRMCAAIETYLRMLGYTEFEYA
jgi:hypothetical protein